MWKWVKDQEMVEVTRIFHIVPAWYCIPTQFGGILVPRPEIEPGPSAVRAGGPNPLDRQGLSDVAFTVAKGPQWPGELWVDSCPHGWLVPDGFPRDKWADEMLSIGKTIDHKEWHGWACQCVACDGLIFLIWSLVMVSKDTWYCMELCSKQNSRGSPPLFSCTRGDLEDGYWILELSHLKQDHLQRWMHFKKWCRILVWGVV